MTTTEIAKTAKVLKEMLPKITHGEVVLTIHDGKLKYVEKSEKLKIS
jgi:hypothetical protein